MTENDLDLLRRYAREKSEDAFSSLVNRHLNLVYSAALRQVRLPQLAEEVAQSVFTDLARSARRLAPDTVLSAWLYQVTRRTAIDVVRREARRELREQIATEMNALNARADDWTHIEPLLDDAMAALEEADRAAILLRYFENQPLREVGQQLGVSDDAAQKRVSRAIERLREFLSKRGVTIGAGGLVAMISANAVHAAPAGLSAAILTSFALAGTVASTSTAVAATKTIVMTTFQKTLIAAVIATGAGTAIYQAHRASVAVRQTEQLRRQLSPLQAEVESLRRVRDDATNRLAALQVENDLLRPSNAKLLRLRAEVTRLRTELMEASENPPTPTEAQSWLSRLQQLKERLSAMPDQQIPELRFLSEKDWLNVARDVVVSNDVSLLNAFSRLRTLAKKEFAPMLSRALREYARANNNQVPPDILDLQPYFVAPVSEAMLQRYQLGQTGNLDWKAPAVAEKEVVDKRTDSLFKIGADGYWWASGAGVGESGMTTFNSSASDRPLWIDQMMDSAPPSPPPEPDVSPELKTLNRPLQAFLASHNGRAPSGPDEILPYLQTAAERSAFDNLMQISQQEDSAMTAFNAASIEHGKDVGRVNSALMEFTKANQGRWPGHPSDLNPYLKTPEDQAAFGRMLERIGKE